MTIPEAKRITRKNEWRQLIHERQQSGQSVRTWCLQNGIRENSLRHVLPGYAPGKRAEDPLG